MRWLKMRWLKMRCLFALCLFFCLSYAFVQTEALEQDVRRYQNLLQSQDAELATIDDVIRDVRRELEHELAERDRLSENLATLRDERDAISVTIEELRLEQQANEQERNQLQVQLENLKVRLQALLVSLHKGRSTPYVRLLTESESLFDLRLNARYLSTLTQQDVQLLQAFEETEGSLARVNARLEAQVQEMAQQVRALEQKAAEVRAARQALDNKIAELEADQAGRLASRERAIQEQHRIDALLNQAQQNLVAERERQRQARIEAERRAAEARRVAEAARRERAAAAARAEADQAEAEAEAAATVIERISVPESAQGNFQSPFSNASVSVPYGDEGPFILLKAERSYEAVRSVLPGVVLAASRASANSGYVVMVQHSQDLVSAYSNLQEPLVAEAQQISQGQVLGYVGGSTFNATDILDFRLGVPQSSGGIAWIDPSARLGLQ